VGVTDTETSAVAGSAEFVPPPPLHPAKMKKGTKGGIEDNIFPLLSHTLCKAVEFPINWRFVGGTEVLAGEVSSRPGFDS